MAFLQRILNDNMIIGKQVQSMTALYPSPHTILFTHLIKLSMDIGYFRPQSHLIVLFCRSTNSRLPSTVRQHMVQNSLDALCSNTTGYPLGFGS